MQGQRRFGPRLRGALAAAMLAFTAGGACALEGAVGWRCMQETDAAFNVACFLEGRDGLPLVDDLLVDDPVPPIGARPGRDLRPVAMRPADEVHAVEVWRVPLYAPPMDSERVAELLRATLCGRHPDCSVRYVDAGLLADARLNPRR